MIGALVGLCVLLPLALPGEALAAAGGLDPGFGIGGQLAIDSGGNDRAQAVALQPDGKIVAVGTSGSDVVVYRLNPDGSPDRTFDTDGTARIDNGGNETAYALALRPDGKIVVAGYTTAGAVSSDAVVWRLKPDGGTTGASNGALDPTFDTDGAAGLNSGGSEVAQAVALQPDGKIVIAGYTSAGAVGDDAVVWRLKPDGGTTNASNGALDPTFDTDGAAGLNSGGDEYALAVALQPDGKIVIAGYTSAGAVGTDAVVWRVKPDGGTTGASNGALDPTFDTDGAAGLNSGGSEFAEAVALQPDRKIVIAGDTGSDALVYRLFGDPFTLTVGKSGSGAGSVVSTPAGIDCGLTCSSGFDAGTQVTLTATPATGSTFESWSGGGCSGNGPCTLTVGPDTAVNATFTATAAGGGGGGGGGLATAAARRLTLSPTRFRAAPSGVSVSAKRKRRPPIGTKVTLLLTASAAANLTVERPATGRRSGKSCVKPTRRNRKARKCTRYIKLRGTITRPAGARSTFTFRGRIGGRKLAPGPYRLVATVGKTAPKRASFTIVR